MCIYIRCWLWNNGNNLREALQYVLSLRYELKRLEMNHHLRNLRLNVSLPLVKIDQHIILFCPPYSVLSYISIHMQAKKISNTLDAKTCFTCESLFRLRIKIGFVDHLLSNRKWAKNAKEFERAEWRNANVVENLIYLFLPTFLVCN